MKDKLQAIREEALKQIRESNRLDKLNEVRVSFLGKKGCIKRNEKCRSKRASVRWPDG